MKRLNSKHKQSKRLTIMIVPDYGEKIRDMHIHRFAFAVLGIPILCIVLLAVLFPIRVGNLEGELERSAAELAAALAENSRLEETLRDTVSSYESIPVEVPTVNEPIDDAVYERIEGFERDIVLLYAKSEVVDAYKEKITVAFEELKSLNLPFVFDLDAIVQNDGVVAMGGPSIEGIAVAIEELDDILSTDIIEMHAMGAYSDMLDSYFKSRPVGWPVEGRDVASEFGYREDPFTGIGTEWHGGIDIAAPMGSSVYATADGVVTFAGWDNEGYGNLVVVEHGYGFSTYYGHNSRVLVAQGDEVVRGDVVALSGDTGRSTGPHCHYEIRVHDTSRDPSEYLS